MKEKGSVKRARSTTAVQPNQADMRRCCIAGGILGLLSTVDDSGRFGHHFPLLILIFLAWAVVEGIRWAREEDDRGAFVPGFGWSVALSFTIANGVMILIHSFTGAGGSMVGDLR